MMNISFGFRISNERLLAIKLNRASDSGSSL
jgi:hypothetical protein